MAHKDGLLVKCISVRFSVSQLVSNYQENGYTKKLKRIVHIIMIFKTMKKRKEQINLPLLIGIMVLTILLVITIALNRPLAQKEVGQIDIPIILFLTGNQAAIGEEVLNAFEIAKNDFENSNPEIKVNLIIEDSGDDPIGSINAYNYLKIRDNYLVFLSTGDSVTSALLPVIREDNKILVTTVVSSPETSGENMFRGFFTSARQGRELGEFVTKEENRKRIAFLFLRNPFSVSFISSFKETMPTDASVVIEENYNIADFDVRTQLVKIKDKNPDALIVAGFGPTFPEIFKQILELNIDIPTYSSDAIGTYFYFNAAGRYEVLNGVIYWDTAFDLNNPITEKMSKFIEEYRRRYNSEPSMFAGYAYDTLTILMAALQECQTDDISVLKSCINDQRISGVFGEVGFDANRKINVPTAIKKFESNRSILLREND